MNKTSSFDEGKVEYVTTHRESAELAFPSAFAWLQSLTPEERLAFLQTVLSAVATAFVSGRWETVAETIQDWQERATEITLPPDEPHTPERDALNQALRQALIECGIDPDAPAPQAAEVRQAMVQTLPSGANLGAEIVAMRAE